MKVAGFTTLTEWADHVAARVIALLEARPDARLCLPTGHTPLPIYHRLAAAVREGRASFRRAEVFLLDEFGGVPVDAEGRCDVMLRRALLDHIDLPADRYHAIDTEAADPDAVSRAYDRLIDGRLDLTLLGIGTNGHVGMNEPGSAPDSPTRWVDLAPDTIAAAGRYFGATPPPTWGITMGLQPILASREIWLLATGATKAPIVRRLLTETPSPALPASLLRRHPNCWLFVDADALAPTLVPAIGDDQ
jgi:glucosamine-6-phosphate deaminase